MKNLIICNFGPIKELTIEFKRVNLILRPQSPGKSTVLKVACFCDWIERQIALPQSHERYCRTDSFVKNLETFHKLEGFMHADTYLRYENDAISFEYDAMSDT